MKYDLEKRIFLNNKCIKLKNIAFVQSPYQVKYRCKTAPIRGIILSIVDNYKNNCSVERKQVVGRKRTVQTWELIGTLKNLYVDDNKLSLRKSANLVPASISTIRNVAREHLNL
jgi:hypothetical protein